MDSIPEGIPEATAVPKLADGTINPPELINSLAEQLANGIMDAEANQVCEVSGNGSSGYRGKSPPGWASRGSPRTRSGTIAESLDAGTAKLLPKGLRKPQR